MQRHYVYVQALKEYLLKSSLHHETQVLQKQTLKEAHIYCLLESISAQQYGPLLEKYIITKYGFVKHPSSNGIGDCSKNGENVEIKTSLGGSHHNKFNFVQIRIAQPIHTYLFTAYHLNSENVEKEGDLYLFRIPKPDMKQLLVQHGGYAHGTLKEYGKITMKSLEEETNTKEYALRPKFMDSCWNDLVRFQIAESDLSS
jgi:hypothetical protein